MTPCRRERTDCFAGPWDGRTIIYCAEHTELGMTTTDCPPGNGDYVLTEMPDGRRRFRYTLPTTTTDTPP